MKLETQVASLDLSKRLKELGVAARGYFKWHFDPHHTWELCRSIEGWGGPEYAAFTVAELGVMLPDFFVSSRYYDAHPVLSRGPFWECHNEGNDEVAGADQTVEMMPTEANARAAMLAHLLENKLITVEEVNARLEAA